MVHILTRVRRAALGSLSVRLWSPARAFAPSHCRDVPCRHHLARQTCLSSALAIAVLAVLVVPEFALAQPWVDVSRKTATSFRTMTQYISVIAIIAGAYLLMFGDGMAKKVIASCFFGVAIALNADTVMGWLF